MNTHQTNPNYFFIEPTGSKGDQMILIEEYHSQASARTRPLHYSEQNEEDLKGLKAFQALEGSEKEDYLQDQIDENLREMRRKNLHRRELERY